MVQNLLLNNTDNITSTRIGSNFKSESTSTDFQKLFESCSNIQMQCKNQVTNSTTEQKNAVSENQTFAGSVIYDIKQLIAFLKTSAQKSDETNSETDSEIQADTEIETDDIEADEIVKKLLHLDDSEEEDDDDNDNNNKIVDRTDVKIQNTVQTEDTQNVISYENLDDILDNLEITQEDTAIETQTTAKEINKETEQTIEDIISEEELQELNIESIEAEMANDNESSDLMKNQTPQEQGVKAMLQADTEFKEIKPAEAQTAEKPAASQEANPDKIIEQITKQMEGLKSGSRVNMVLNPESLGKVSIQLINTKEGLSAQFTVATQDARNLIMKGLDGLKDTLISHGVSVDNVSVKLNDTQESEYNSDWTEQEHSEGGNRQQESKKEQKNKEQFEQMMSSLKENGNV